MATLKLNYRSRKEKTNLEVRLSYKCGKKYKKQRARTKLVMTREFWEEYKTGMSFRDIDKRKEKARADQHFYNLEAFVLDEFEHESEIDEDWLCRTVNNFYNPPKENDKPTALSEYWRYYIELRRNELESSPRNLQKYEEILGRVLRFERYMSRKFKISEVNEEFVRDWINYCFEEKYAKATIEKNLSYIKTICRHAKRKGLAVSPELEDLKISFRKEDIPKVYLSFEEIKKIRKTKDLSPEEKIARDWLVVSCFTGQRISDFMRFRREMIREATGRRFLDFIQKKTRKRVTVPLLPEVDEILEKYDGNFPEPMTFPDYNIEIKQVAKKAGLTQMMKGKVRQEVAKGKWRNVIDDYEKWELVTSHIGRRSLATNYYGIIPTSILKNITAHSTEKMLLRYIGKTSKDTAFEAYDIMTNMNF